MINEENSLPEFELDLWEEDEWLASRRRPFPSYFENVVDTLEGPKVVGVDLRDLTREQLTELIPNNKYAYLELMFRDFGNIQ